MHDPKQPDSEREPPRMAERRHPLESNSTTRPDFQPKRRDDPDRLPPEPPDTQIQEPLDRPD